MQVETRMPFQPCLDLLMLMGAVVVGNQVNLQFLGRPTINLLEKTQPLHMGMFLLGATDDLAIEIIQSSEQRDRPMADIVMRASPEVADAWWKPWLRAFQCLTPSLLIATPRLCPVDSGTDR